MATARPKFEIPVIPEEFKIRLPKVPNKEFITAPGLIYLGHLQGLKRVSCTLIQAPTQEYPWAIVYCEVETDLGVFGDYGESNPINKGAVGAAYPLSIASTRARNRALRQATGCPLTSYEELGSEPEALEEVAQQAPPTNPQRPHGVQEPTQIRPSAVRAPTSKNSPPSAATQPLTQELADQVARMQAIAHAFYHRPLLSAPTTHGQAVSLRTVIKSLLEQGIPDPSAPADDAVINLVATALADLSMLTNVEDTIPDGMPRSVAWDMLKDIRARIADATKAANVASVI